MAADTFDYAGLLRRGLPPAAAKWAGFPPYNFVGGHNDADSVPVDGLIAAATRVLRREGKTLATYGLESGALGYRPLRELIARKLAVDAGVACSVDDILITSGSLQGLDLVNALLLAAGDTVIVEQMTYSGAITRLQRLGVNVVGVPVDRDGLSSDGLAAALEDLKRRSIVAKYIYTIPTVQNPTATVMSAARRAAILRCPKRTAYRSSRTSATPIWSGAGRARRRCAAWRATTGSSTSGRFRRPSPRRCAWATWLRAGL